MPKVKSPLTIEFALLGFLRQEPLHGYEIYRRLSESEGLGLVWHVKQNQLYALLNKLADKGYVTIRLEPQENRPDRKVFHLTESGSQTFLAWVKSPVKHGRKLRLEFLAKLYFARLEGVDTTEALIEQQRIACQTWLNQQRRQAAHLRDSRPYDWLVREFRIGQLEAMLNWLEICQQILPIEGDESRRNSNFF